uniref:Sulfotransferase domain-containing protein n=1 Tax=Amphimedon queenslandica TaxID=400682 RepID=A0A1X7VWT2_AMPQE
MYAGKDFVLAMSSPRTLKESYTHMMSGKNPANSIAKYIYIVHNPKDVAVSYYYHAKCILILMVTGIASLSFFYKRRSTIWAMV